MKKRWILSGVLGILLAVGVATSLAASSADPVPGRLPAYFFGPQMARAEVVMVLGGVVHDYRIDQGRLRDIRPTGLVLAERDLTKQVVPVAPDAQVTLNGAPVALSALRRGLTVLIVRDGAAPASLVRAKTALGR